MTSEHYAPRHRGFSLVELLVVIAVVGVLVALLLPAVQSARAAAQRTQCKSNLRQLGIGLLAFHSSEGRFPYGGWGRAWIPVTDRGIGLDQPGGWVFQSLPFIGESAVFDSLGVASGQIGLGSPARLDYAIAMLTCPSRRAARTYEAGTRFSYQRIPRPGATVDLVARGDFAINSGTSHAFPLTGPPSLDIGDDPTFWRSVTDNRDFSGISHLHRSISLRRVPDGASKTYLAGEKFLAPRFYADSSLTASEGIKGGDEVSLFSGFAVDNHRYAATPGSVEGTIRFLPPARDTDDVARDGDGHLRFGSPHAVGCHFLLCDGSVSVVNYDVDETVHYLFANRRDGGTLE